MTDAPQPPVRDAAPRDAERIARMANRLALLTAGVAGRMTPARVETDLIRRPGLGCLVAERDGVAAGYALYTEAYETAYAARGLYLSDLYVMAEARRRGLARALMAEIARRAEAGGGQFVWWVVAPGGEEAHAFYDGLGATREEVAARALFDAPFARLKR